MKRRDAMKLLAASGAAVTASTIASQPAFADGGSAADLVVYGAGALTAGAQYGPTHGAFPGSTGAIFCNFADHVDCVNPSAVRKREYRVTLLGETGVSVTLTTTPATTIGSWSPVADAYITVTYNSDNGQSVIGGSMSVRFEYRVTCCGPGATRSWRCFQTIADVQFIADGQTLVGNTRSPGSVGCNASGGPSCP